MANNCGFSNTIIRIGNYPISLTHSDIEQVCPIEGYSEQEIRQCVFDLCNGNSDIRQDYLEWLGVEKLLDVIHKAFQQGATRILQFIPTWITTIETHELEF